jgi:hypothetical protein
VSGAPDFQCPFCRSMVQRANVEKHLLNQHRDTHTLHKYVACPVCEALVLKNKLTPHLRKEHALKGNKR